jgi:hypothetical protein
MNTQHNQIPQKVEKLKEIPKWTRRYAQNRTLADFLLMVILILISMVIAALSYLAGAAFIKGNVNVFGVCIVVLFAILVFVLIIRVSKFDGVIIRRWLDQLIYDHEGTASMPQPKLTKKWLRYAVGAVVFIFIQGSYYLSMKGYIAFKYMQPVSALYLVPGLVHLYFVRRPRIGPLALICPILYAIHAILIVAGVPLYFKGNWGIWNMAVPFVGYTFLAYAISHIYNRYALRKLKGITHLEGEATNGV